MHWIALMETIWRYLHLAYCMPLATMMVRVIINWYLLMCWWIRLH